MNYDPLQEISMPDLEVPVEDEVVESILPSEEVVDDFDVEGITEALSEAYPDIKVEDEEPAEIRGEFTPEQQANLDEQERMRTEMYARDPRSESGLNEDQGGWDSLMDIVSAPSAGINDYIIDEVNKLPFANFRKRPQYENELAKSIRGISGLILPFLGLKGSVKGVSGNIAARSPLATRAPKTNRALKWMLDLGIDTGIGAYVDSTAKTNQLDDNLAGFLKKEWKAVGKYIPSDWLPLMVSHLMCGLKRTATKVLCLALLLVSWKLVLSCSVLSAEPVA